MSLRCNHLNKWITISSDRIKKRGVELKEAYNQIQRYHKTSFHGLFDYIQLFVISNGVNTRYFANNPNGGYKFTFNWTDAENIPLTI